MTTIREARDTDVEQVRDLFARVYGVDYPFPGFYDTEWLKKSVYDDNTLFLIAEVENVIVATGSIMLTAGGLNDLIGEIGRLVAEPTKRARGAATDLVGQLVERTLDKVQFCMSEVRTRHTGSQRLGEQFGWIASGFEPMKYQLQERESMVFYAKLQGMALELRRNNPRVIPEVAVLAKTVLKNMELPVDVIVEDEDNGYPTEQEYKVDRLQEQGVSSLLRIERGRITNREIFGNLALSHGIFRIANSNSHYLVAREGEAVVGAVGFTHDPIDKKVRIFELIEFDDAVKGYLLASVDRLAREEFGVEYQEVDISAYSPKIQRTFERLGFVPVAYCPSMVFDNVERLDVIRMAKISCRYDLGRMRLLETGTRMKEIVEKGLEDRLLGIEVTAATRKTELFKGLPEGDLNHLARIAKITDYTAGTKLLRQGDEPDQLYILVEGEAEARAKGKLLGTLKAGSIFGEMSLVEKTRRSADVILTKPSKVIAIGLPQLERLMQAHPRLGHVVSHNLASSLSAKLRRLQADNS
ncbi:MAG: cyclic nucleotide-binding domain-containing protein [Planctomycetes bacterium]|nr:cyclic nucleotide-binding domain-containing protein [Planctomycetota bacterium]